MTNKKPESSKAYAAFMQYRGLGPGRSLAKLADHLGRNKAYIRQLEIWCKDFHWVERAKSYDKENLEKESKAVQEQKIKRELERQAAIDEMRERQARTSRELQELTVKHLRMQVESGDIGSLPAVHLYKLLLETEQKATGDTVEKIELTGKDGGVIEINTQWGTPKVGREKDESS